MLEVFSSILYCEVYDTTGIEYDCNGEESLSTDSSKICWLVQQYFVSTDYGNRRSLELVSEESLVKNNPYALLC